MNGSSTEAREGEHAEVISVRGVSKDYRRRTVEPGIKGALKGLFHRKREILRAVDHIDFSIRRGEMVGYIGPNGAGKSTTIKMLCGVLLPTEGDVRVAGFDPFAERRKCAPNIAAVFGQRNLLWMDLPAADTMKLHKHIYRMSDEVYERQVAYLKECLELEEFWDMPVRQLSLGQKMRSNLAVSLLHNPSILFLDEPTVGMDVLIKAKFRDMLRDLQKRLGITVVLTTHDLFDVEDLCRRVVIIDTGHIVYDGDIDAMKAAASSTKYLIIDLASDAHAETLPDGAEIEREEELRLRIRFDAKRVATPDLVAHVTKTLPVRDLTIKEQDLESIIRDMYARSAARKG